VHYRPHKESADQRGAAEKWPWYRECTVAPKVKKEAAADPGAAFDAAAPAEDDLLAALTPRGSE
jgi:hypothetical protein